jgi:hypothetical protein
MRGDQSSSDPLPYTQVDRSAKPKATLVAGTIGCTPQHALGSLIEYWDLNGDPRELERILLRTPAGEKAAVLITAEQAATRFRIASGGKELSAEAQVALGILEQREGGQFRVRGMSRYFEPVAKRISARLAATAGGKASAERRKAKYGTAQPTGGRGSEGRSDLSSVDRSVVASEVVRTASEPEPKREPKRNRTDNRSGTEAEPNPRGQRSDDRSLKEEIVLSTSGASELPLPGTDAATEVFTYWQKVMKKPPTSRLTDERRKAVSARLKDGYSVAQIKRAIDGCSKTPHNCGENANHTRYDDLELICRNGSNLERFMANAESNVRSSNGRPEPVPYTGGLLT